MMSLLLGLAAPAARRGGGRKRSGAARGATALQQGLEGPDGPRVGFGVAHQARGVHERQTDPLAVVGELLAVEIRAADSGTAPTRASARTARAPAARRAQR